MRPKIEMGKWVENCIKSEAFEDCADKTVEVGCIDKNVEILFRRYLSVKKMKNKTFPRVLT